MTDFLSDSFQRDCVRFVRSMGSAAKKGYYKYSLTGDLRNENVHWGLGNTVFAAKSLYMLDALTEADRDEMAGFISSFQNADNYITDPVVARKLSLARRILAFGAGNTPYEQTKRAETRQAFAALRCLGKKPGFPFAHIPSDKDGIKKYVHALDWANPWGAASHVSHLLFFLHNNCVLFGGDKLRTEELIKIALAETDSYRQADGSWHAEGAQLPAHIRVNGAMKMMTAYAAAERDDFAMPEKLIDLCLASINDGDACNNFNVICVLYYCFRRTAYRKADIERYCTDRLERYNRHYWPEYGGFSFHERRANDIYYGAKISKGLPEPDIHGTVLFLWGIALISRVVKSPENIEFKLPVT